MLGELTRAEIEQVLLREVVGRIGCHAEGRTYVVPITYAYDGEHVYAHSRDGLKIRTMRANPNVCFEVEQIEDLAHWRSVVAWGTYEELHASDEPRAMAVLRSRFPAGASSETARLHPVTHAGVDQARTIYFRIRLEEKAGRFER
ncbi:MAG TPA: pyridoxamine 5'-phosphate oxidase family protein [Polyangiaceae bacterium]|nr:pyridoxamine 5'-phosphate oxidase family protein [Polyangiaceae bacterium]